MIRDVALVFLINERSTDLALTPIFAVISSFSATDMERPRDAPRRTEAGLGPDLP